MASNINIDEIFFKYAGLYTDSRGNVAGDKAVVDLYKEMTPSSVVTSYQSEADRLLVMLYFRWITMQSRNRYGISSLVNSAHRSDKVNAFLESKKPGLSKVTDWEFSGMIDFGFQGAIRCSNGNHALRYAYYAYSPSMDIELVFGSSCGSDFFDMDIASLQGMQQELEKAKYQMGYSFSLGRCPAILSYTAAYNMINVISRYPVIAELCLDSNYVGRTTFELWSNFISRGIYPPLLLKTKVVNGYQKAVKTFLEQKFASDANLGDKIKQALITCESTIAADTHIVDDMEANPGIVHSGEFIAPLSGCNLFDALRVLVLEEALNPTPISAYYDILSYLDDIAYLEQSVKASGVRCAYSRAELVERAVTKDLKSDIKDIISLLGIAAISNDLRLVTLLLGLSPNSSGEVPFFKEGTNYEGWRSMDSKMELSLANSFNCTPDEVLDVYGSKIEDSKFSPNVFMQCWGAADAEMALYLAVHTNTGAIYYNSKRSLLLALFLNYFSELRDWVDNVAKTRAAGITCLRMENEATREYSDSLFSIAPVQYTFDPSEQDTVADYDNLSEDEIEDAIYKADEQFSGTSMNAKWNVESGMPEFDMTDDDSEVLDDVDDIIEEDTLDTFDEDDSEALDDVDDIVEEDTSDTFDEEATEEEYIEEEPEEEEYYDEDSFEDSDEEIIEEDDSEEYIDEDIDDFDEEFEESDEDDTSETSSDSISGKLSLTDVFNMLGGGTNVN